MIAVGGALLVTLDGDAASSWLRGIRLRREAPRVDDELLPPGILGPHAGEQRRRAREAELVGRGGRSPEAAPEPSRREPKPSDLYLAGAWEESLLGLVAARAKQPERAMLDILNEAFCRAQGAVTRQNLIFLMALCVEPDQSIPWLRALGKQQGADAEDAWTALAYLGDGEGHAYVVRYADDPQPEHVENGSWRDHEAIGERNDERARRLLRPYRAIEVLLRRPYFGRTDRTAARTWVQGSPPSPSATADLLEAWLRHYPGHAGSDDVALYLARGCVREGRVAEAARWYARSCTTGDMDAAEESMRGLLACVELLLGEHEIAGVLDGLEGAPRLADLLEYVRIRRRAARGDLTGALQDVEHHASRRPRSIFGVAWKLRRQHEPSQGLESGTSPLPADDPLRAADPIQERIQAPEWHESSGRRRGSPPLFYRWNLRGDQPLMLPSEWAFAAQLRGWETLGGSSGVLPGRAAPRRPTSATRSPPSAITTRRSSFRPMPSGASGSGRSLGEG